MLKVIKNKKTRHELCEALNYARASKQYLGMPHSGSMLASEAYI